MIPYIITFVITNLIAYFAEINLKKENKKMGVFLLIIAVLPLSILAGIRAVDLGWDVELYGEKVYLDIAKINNFFGFLNYMNSSGIESGFLFLIFFLTKIYKNLNFVLFGLNLISTLSFIYFAYNKKEKCSITFMFFVFECTLYPITFSTLRQCISMSISMISCVLFEKNKNILGSILLLMGLLFHNSAIFAFILPLIIKFNDSKKLSLKDKIAVDFFIVLVIACFLLFYDNIIILANKVGILSDKYVLYLSNEYNYDGIKIRWSVLLMKTFVVFMGFLYFMCKKIQRDDKEKNLKWYVMILMDYLLMFLSFKILNVHRVTYYVYYSALFAFVPQLSKVLKNDRANQILGNFIILLVFLMFYMQNLVGNYYDMYPYRCIF